MSVVLIEGECLVTVLFFALESHLLVASNAFYKFTLGVPKILITSRASWLPFAVNLSARMAEILATSSTWILVLTRYDRDSLAFEAYRLVRDCYLLILVVYSILWIY